MFEHARPRRAGGLVLRVAILCATLGTAMNVRADAIGPVVDLWYGSAQTFGDPGVGQRWVNVLGNVSDVDGVNALTYSLNGGAAQSLTIGPDTRRLLLPGDFNVEIDFIDLNAGSNGLTLVARNALFNESTTHVSLNYVAGQVWPLPVTPDLSGSSGLQEVMQVVDGEWFITSNGLRCPDMGYDRVIALGDLAWADYEITATITMLELDPAGYLWPSVSPGFGITLRWPGHSDDPVVCAQPHCGWLPAGGTVWYNAGGDGPLRLDGDLGLLSEQSRTLGYFVPYRYRFRVQTVPGSGTFYAAKVWEASGSEPGPWDMSGFEPEGDELGGSAIFIAHHVDILVEDVAVIPLSDSTPPVISNVQVAADESSATVTWNTDELTTGSVAFGPTVAYENGSVASAGLDTAHEVLLGGLTPGLTYHYQITALDANTNATTTVDATFVAQADTDPPVISNVVITPSDVSATITWTTDEPATSRVAYGLTSAYGDVTSNGTLATSHSITIVPLVPETTYHCEIASADADGNLGTNGNLSFATTATSSVVLVSDHFNDPALDTSVWTFINPLGDASVAMSGTQVRIELPVTGNDHEIWVNGNSAPRIVQPAPDTDFECVAKFDSALTQDLQIQGIAVEEDPDNVVRTEFHRILGGTRIYVASIFDGVADTHIHQPITLTPPMFLKVRREGDQFTISRSLDGENYTVAANFAQPMTVTGVSIHMGGSAGTAHTMLADYFLDLSEPVSTDCNSNGIDDALDLSGGTATDCNASGVPDTCELTGNDCDTNGVPDECDTDCNSNGTPDACETFTDCNANAIPDVCELAGNDCNTNGVPDECDTDCNSNGTPDACESFTDCNVNAIPDVCELTGNDCDTNGVPDECDVDCDSSGTPDACESFTDCNVNAIPDVCELTGNDCDTNGVPDECDIDCDWSGTPDACEVFTDCNANFIPDVCELTGNDCDTNGVPDECDIDCDSSGTPDACETFTDCNANAVPDVCELSGNDCDTNGVPDECDVDCDSSGTPDACEVFADCNANFIPDVCELTGNDCDSNGVPDECDIDCDSSGIPDACEVFADCNANFIPDGCELIGNDCDTNGVPDECDMDCDNSGLPDACETLPDCNTNGAPDACDILAGTSVDQNGDAIPDACQVRNLTRQTAHATITAAIAGALSGDELLSPPVPFNGEFAIDFSGKALSLASTAQIDQPAGAEWTLADAAVLATAPGAAAQLAGMVTLPALDDADLVAREIIVGTSGLLDVGVSAGLAVTAPAGLTVHGTALVFPQATLVVSDALHIPGALEAFGAVVAASPIEVNTGGLLSGYGDFVGTIINSGGITLVADTQVIGDFANDGVTTIQGGTLTVTGSYTGGGTLIGDFAASQSPSEMRAGSGGLLIAGDYFVSADATLLLAGADWTLRVGGAFDVAIDDAARFDLSNAELRMVGLGTFEQPLELMSENIGASLAGLQLNAPSRFPIGNLRIGPMPTTVRLVDDRANATPAGEVAYVDHLVIDPGATLITDGHVIYYRTLELAGTVDDPANLIPLLAAPGDCDADGDVDVGDLAGMIDCLAGPGSVPPLTSSLGCACLAAFDFDGDLDVDLRDYAEACSLP